MQNKNYNKMKKTSFITTFLMICNLTFAQWTELSVGSTNNFNSIFFVNSDTGVVVGENGAILKTTDGGSNWSVITSGTTETLNSVKFPSDSISYIVGNNGTILKSTDGGDSWNNQTSPAMGHLMSVSYINNDTVLVVGNGGSEYIILKTVDGGTNWTTIANGFGDGLTSIHMVNETTGYNVGLAGHNNKTTNGGASWIYTPGADYMPFTEVYYPSVKVGFIVGQDNTIRRTMDSASTFTTLTPDATFTGAYHAVFFIDNQEGYIAGDDKTVLKTIDAGTNWTVEHQELSSLINFKSIHFPNPSVGYAAGDNGTVLKTIEGTGLNDNESLNTWTLHPNPFDNSATLTFENFNNINYTLTLFNTQGRLVRTNYNINTGRTIVEREDLTSGLYFFQLRSDGQGPISGKLTIE